MNARFRLAKLERQLPPALVPVHVPATWPDFTTRCTGRPRWEYQAEKAAKIRAAIADPRATRPQIAAWTALVMPIEQAAQINRYGYETQDSTSS